MKTIASLMLALAIVCPAVVGAQAALGQQDADFLNEAAQFDLLQTQAAQLALQSAEGENVKQYARTLLSAYEQNGKELRQLADTHDVKLPAQLQGKFQSKLADLQQEKGMNFDRRYIDDIAIGAHENAIGLFSRVAQETPNADIKIFAEKSLKMLRQHLNRAKTMSRQDREHEPGAERPDDATSSERNRQAAPKSSLPPGQARPQGSQPTMEGEPGTPEKAAGMQ